jgi:uncharacterized glyoxalase superfamily protein PhnB
MNSLELKGDIVMKYMCALITVEDISISRYFYESILHQKVKYDFGENVMFEGGFAIHLKSHFASLIGNKPIVSGGNDCELYFEDDDIETLMKELQSRSIECVHGLKEQPWRQRVVRFYDPDRHIVEVGETIEYLSYRLSIEGHSIDEIARITNMPSSFVAESIEMKRAKE